MNNEITFDIDVLQRLKKAYEQAESLKQDKFMFEGNELLTKYAMYLIQYLEFRLRVKEHVEGKVDKILKSGSDSIFKS